MRKFLIVILVLTGVLYLSVKVFQAYNSTDILSNQAVFEVYLNIPKEDVDAYFALPKGTYNKETHTIAGILPVDFGDTKPRSQPVKFGSKINCNEKYDSKNHIKHEFGLNNNDLEIVLVDNYTPGQFNVDSGLSRIGIIASKKIRFHYSRGKINHVVISNNGANDYCSE